MPCEDCKPRTITTAEELDALAVGSVVLSEKYNFLPATVLWEPR